MLISPIADTDPVLTQLVSEQRSEMAAIEGNAHINYPLHDGIEYVAAFLDGRPAGCGGLQPIEEGIGEVKRMYVRPAFRRQGLSRLILAAIEEQAVDRGYHTLRLETGGHFAAAMALYTGAGYKQIPLYGEYVGNPTSVCFEKVLVG